MGDLLQKTKESSEEISQNIGTWVSKNEKRKCRSYSLLENHDICDH